MLEIAGEQAKACLSVYFMLASSFEVSAAITCDSRWHNIIDHVRLCYIIIKSPILGLRFEVGCSTWSIIPSHWFDFEGWRAQAKMSFIYYSSHVRSTGLSLFSSNCFTFLKTSTLPSNIFQFFEKLKWINRNNHWYIFIEIKFWTFGVYKANIIYLVSFVLFLLKFSSNSLLQLRHSFEHLSTLCKIESTIKIHKNMIEIIHWYILSRWHFFLLKTPFILKISVSEIAHWNEERTNNAWT